MFSEYMLVLALMPSLSAVIKGKAGWILKVSQLNFGCCMPALAHDPAASKHEDSKGQTPLRYPASEPARELVADLVSDLSQTCRDSSNLVADRFAALSNWSATSS